MLGSLGSLTGGGGMSASSSASSSQESQNQISSGTITVGGLNMMPKQSGLNADLVVNGAVVVGVGLAALWAFKKIKSK